MQGFPELGISGLARSYKDLKPTCCHLALDKPTRLPGDYIFVSDQIESSNIAVGELEVVSAPLLEVGNPNQEYPIHLKHKVLSDGEFNVTSGVEKLTLGAKSYIEALEKMYPEKDYFSDHVQVKRSIGGVEVYSNNASFVLLNKIAAQKAEDKYSIGGSEEMFVRALMQGDWLPEDKFATFMTKFEPKVVGVQEATLIYFKHYMEKLNEGKHTCFYCQTGFEGSAILVDPTLVSQRWLKGKNYWFHGIYNERIQLGDQSYTKQEYKEVPQLNNYKSYVWAVCGEPGRTFSAVVLTIENKDILMLNVHSPNPAAENNKTISWEEPYNKSARDNEFRTKGYTRQYEWLKMLLLEKSENVVVQKIQNEYNDADKCGRRLLIVGDFNDASRLYITSPPVKAPTRRPPSSLVLPQSRQIPHHYQVGPGSMPTLTTRQGRR